MWVERGGELRDDVVRPVRVLAPELATLAAALEDIPSLEDLDIAKVDAEEASSLASRHGVGAYPTTL